MASSQWRGFTRTPLSVIIGMAYPPLSSSSPSNLRKVATCSPCASAGRCPTCNTSSLLITTPTLTTRKTPSLSPPTASVSPWPGCGAVVRLVTFSPAPYLLDWSRPASFRQSPTTWPAHPSRSSATLVRTSPRPLPLLPSLLACLYGHCTISRAGCRDAMRHNNGFGMKRMAE